MLTAAQLNDAAIQKLQRKFQPDEIIFQQGKPGESMFLVVEGFVRILYQSENERHLIGIVSAGEVVGEKAILKEKSPYKRNFTAQAKTSVTLLEINRETLKVILKIWPDFFSRVLLMVEERLDKANHLVSVLQNDSPVDRVVGFIHYFHKHFCKKLPKGMFLAISGEEIEHGSNVRPHIVQDILKELTEKKIISNIGKDYVLTDEKKLTEFTPQLRSKLAA